MSKWQPLSTAPKDGTDILIRMDCASVIVLRYAWYDTGERYTGTIDPANVGWWTYNNSVSLEKLSEFYLTGAHWQHIDVELS